ncbi:Zinc carboxypeptidase [Luteibacter sp. UNC138MFCol5.1]|uniref:M14 family metallopeptidase n=1 Tax=Luteibacter sp. UNC138MFCol5.1 TaxID=1502774 RepID=UPI0008AF7589|nr:M14 family metallopeptidase [Luteibacter sp. UNC138MFCol5.1]SEO86213.1 Zinc carboxypeptidase [Luteibacter sp. UNC138MFCol5.1]
MPATFPARLLLGLIAAAPFTLHAKDSWITPAEASGFRTTPSYADTEAYLRRLADASQDTLRVETFGTSPEGRPMTVVVAAKDGDLTPERARAAGKPIVLLQAGIHPGEIEGKDAGLMLLRDFAATGRLPHLLDHAVLVFIPVYSVDGHENSGPYFRINQNGPEEMGFRGQSQYLNLNRDYVKADAPETRAWLKLWNAWRPDLLIDIHTTDGADYQYDLTWYAEDAHKLPPSVAAWQQATYAGKVMPRYEKLGHLASPYLEFRDGRDITKGIQNFGSGPRFSTGYAAIRNRAGLLIETHMLKSYEVRVRATYDVVRSVLDTVDASPAALLDASKQADAWAASLAARPGATLPVTFREDPTPTPFTLKGYAFTQTPSDISGDTWVRYDPTRKKTYAIQSWNGLLPDVAAPVPAAWAIPAQWTQIIERLDAHGIPYTRTTRSLRVPVSRDRLTQPRWAEKPFEGHHLLRDVTITPTPETVELPAGTVIVRADNTDAVLALNLLDPRAPDSMLRWGYLDAIFEPKEYGEPRVQEALARDMIAKDPALKATFDEKLRSDPAFAANPRARLSFFFERSPWYAAQEVGAYPVVRLDAAALQQAR